MNDDIREDVAFDLDSCTPEEFLKEYVSRDEDFEELLESEFSIEVTKATKEEMYVQDLKNIKRIKHRTEKET